MKRSILGLLTLSLLATTSAQKGTQGTGTQVYTAVTSSSVVLLQWTEAAGQLRGTAQAVSVDPGPGDIHLTVSNAGLSGTHSGDSYAFTFDAPILGPRIFSAPATLRQGVLVLNIPLDSGGLGSVQLTKSTPEKFNAAVSNLKNIASDQVDALHYARELSNAREVIPKVLSELKRSVPNYESDLAVMKGYIQKAKMSQGDFPSLLKEINAAYDRQDCGRVNQLITTFRVARSKTTDALTALAQLDENMHQDAVALRASVFTYENSMDVLRRRGTQAEVASFTKVNGPLVARATQAIAAAQPLFALAEALAVTVPKGFADYDNEIGSIVCTA